MDFRKIFDTIPEEFDKWRPRYCEELFNDVIEYSKLDSSKSNANAIKAKQHIALSNNDKENLAKTARGFESIFVNMIYKGMKLSMLDSIKDDKKDEMSFGADTLSGVTDMAFSDYISNQGNGIGIAEMIYKQFTNESLKTLDKKLFQVSNLNANNKRMICNIYDKSNFNFNLTDNNITPLNDNFFNRVNQRLEEYDKIIQNAANCYNINPSLIKAVITVESAGNPNAKSPVGAKGLMQLMDKTAMDLGVKNS